MAATRGNRVAWWTAGLGMLVLVVAGVVLKDWVEEEWWLRRFETGDEEERTVAARRLGELRSVRAVQPLLRELRRECVEASTSQLDHDAGEAPDGRMVFVVIVEKAERYQKALVQIGEGALLALVRALSDEESVYSSLCAQCIWLIGDAEGLTTGLTRPHAFLAESCAPILHRLSSDSGRPQDLRAAAAQALKQFEADEARRRSEPADVAVPR